MIRQLPVAAALAIIAAAGVANGLWNDRWRVSPELARMTERLPKIPQQIGLWHVVDKSADELKEEKTFNDRLKREGALHELVSRTYRRDTGETVAVLLATGRPGPISAHNPLTCIGAGDNVETLSPVIPKKLTVDGHDIDFTYCDFLKIRPVGGGMGMRVYWSWHDDKKGWVGARDPRSMFARQRALTKIYVTRVLTPSEIQKKPSGENSGEKDDAVVQFIEECLPAIDKALFD
jgi:hypothetical protein